MEFILLVGLQAGTRHITIFIQNLFDKYKAIAAATATELKAIPFKILSGGWNGISPTPATPSKFLFFGGGGNPSPNFLFVKRSKLIRFKGTHFLNVTLRSIIFHLLSDVLLLESISAISARCLSCKVIRKSSKLPWWCHTLSFGGKYQNTDFNAHDKCHVKLGLIVIDEALQDVTAIGEGNKITTLLSPLLQILYRNGVYYNEILGLQFAW